MNTNRPDHVHNAHGRMIGEPFCVRSGHVVPPARKPLVEALGRVNWTTFFHAINIGWRNRC